MSGFNLRREANPLATSAFKCKALSLESFQSQARSQSPGDLSGKNKKGQSYEVSISGEKPIPWRHGFTYFRGD